MAEESLIWMMWVMMAFWLAGIIALAAGMSVRMVIVLLGISAVIGVIIIWMVMYV